MAIHTNSSFSQHFGKADADAERYETAGWRVAARKGKAGFAILLTVDVPS
jgi:hypothetical protein